jgi:tRNA threonylcarbamoyl adenosine modification protein (Sua5/YciO/YrdC/YwlC family)
MPPRVIDVRKADDVRDVVHRAVQALAEGQLVAFPTETVYGVAASCCLDSAIERLCEAKGRPTDAPFTLAIKSAEEAEDFVPDLSPLAKRLARRCWPGPLTLVVDDAKIGGLSEQFSPRVRQTICPKGTIGLRVPASGILLDVLRMLAGPLALTSANKSGQPDALTAQDTVKQLGDSVQLVLDTGPAHYGQSSSVVRVEGNMFKMLRPGVVDSETLERLSRASVVMVCTGNTCRSPMAEILMRKQLADRLGVTIADMESKGVQVVSAGLAAAHGSPASPESVQLMTAEKLPLDEHQSQPLTEQMLRHADLILTMTNSHRRAIVESFPLAAPRTFVLMPDGTDVADPIGGPLEMYRECAQQIKAGVAHFAPLVVEQIPVKASF